MMVNGMCYLLPPLEPTTSGDDSGSWPTPMATPGMLAEGHAILLVNKHLNGELTLDEIDSILNRTKYRKKLGLSGKAKNTIFINPKFYEWLMGWPLGWSQVNVLDKDTFKRWKELMHNGTWWSSNYNDDKLIKINNEEHKQEPLKKRK